MSKRMKSRKSAAGAKGPRKARSISAPRVAAGVAPPDWTLLSPELLHIIFEAIPPKALLMCRGVCSTFRTAASCRELWIPAFSQLYTTTIAEVQGTPTCGTRGTETLQEVLSVLQSRSTVNRVNQAHDTDGTAAAQGLSSFVHFYVAFSRFWRIVKRGNRDLLKAWPPSTPDAGRESDARTLLHDLSFQINNGNMGVLNLPLLMGTLMQDEIRNTLDAVCALPAAPDLERIPNFASRDLLQMRSEIHRRIALRNLLRNIGNPHAYFRANALFPDDFEIVVMVGLPASGKTRYVENHLSEYDRVTLDKNYGVTGLEDKLKAAYRAHQSRKTVSSIVVDGRHSNGTRHRANIVCVAENVSVPLRVVWCSAPWKICKKRNASRTDREPANSFEFTAYQQYFERPSLLEGFESITEVP